MSGIAREVKRLKSPTAATMAIVVLISSLQFVYCDFDSLKQVSGPVFLRMPAKRT